ncbi:MAG TPA: NmrA family NAD(P)-binding protein [Terracidiphilus sp.]|nr:NmrA family NAD(P)-binding protein [Terracidiphilus sp.]
MRVLMIGATGRYAGHVLPELLKRGIMVRALVRTRAAEHEARKRGADETVMGNLEDPRGLISAAVGADGVFHIGPAFHPREAEMGVTMVDAAKAAGVRRFVFSSVIHPSISRLANHAAKRPVEEALYESGMTFTVLQPGSFMQNVESDWDRVLDTGVFALPYSQRVKVCYVDYRDVAEAAAMAFIGDRLDNGTFELCAPGLLSRIQVAGLMSEALGRRIEAARVDFEEWADRAGLPQGPRRAGMQRLFADYDQFGFHGGNGLILRSILGREPRSLRLYFRELAGRVRKAAA